MAAHDPLAEPVIDTSDIGVLERAMLDPGDIGRRARTSFKEARLTISRHDDDDIQDRQIYVFVDGQPWGKIRYGQTISREVAPGHHTVRASNTLFSRTLDLDVRPAEHARVRCGTGISSGGWLMFMFLHVAYLIVRLERESSDS